MVRKSIPTDNEQLIRLTTRNPMAGAISLKIDRRPDFFALSRLRGATTTFVVEDCGQIVGCFSASKTKVFVNRQPTDIYYLSDLKMDAPHRGGSHLYRLVRRMHAFLKKKKAGPIFCTVAKGNELVKPLLIGRLGFPAFQHIGCFKVIQLLPVSTFRSSGSIEVKEVQPTVELTGQFNQFNRAYQLGKALSVIPEGSRFWAAYRDNQMVAGLSVLDTFAYKQNVVIDASPALRTLIKVSKLAAGVFSTPSLPAIGEPLKMLYVNNFFYLKGEEEGFLTLIGRARQEAFQRTTHFLSIGIHERDPLLAHFQSYWKKVTFSSNGYLCNLNKDSDWVENILQGVPYEDFSLV